MNLFTTLSAAATCAILAMATGCSEKSGQTQSTQSTDAMLAEADRLSQLCIDGPPGDLKTFNACNQRADLVEKLKTNGRCWGPKNAIGVDKHWMLCKDDLLESAPPVPQRWFVKAHSGTCEEMSIEQATQKLLAQGHKDVKTRPAATGEIHVYADILGGSQIVIDLQAECKVDTEVIASLAVAKKALDGKDYATAFNLYTPLSERGNAEAQAHLGLMYELGQGTNKDFDEAFKWYFSAAEQGVNWAQTNLGAAYLSGRGTKKDEREAVKWFRKAALQGSTRAQEVLGAMYNQGRGIPQDQKEAAEWINPSNLTYIAKLEKDYRSRVHFETAKSEKIIREFNIDCNAPQKNGHYLPLINLLHARLATVDNDKAWVESTVQERDGEVRVIDSLYTPKGIIHASNVFEINKWGELRPLGSITTDAIRNACFGSHGPIWLLN
ncbi:MAG: tetratricopeptide repeat protein [Burkholderiaceae bacterium]